VARRPSRPFANKNDPDLIPPEERRARRFRRLLFLAIPAAVGVVAAIYFAARPSGGAIKAWQSRRLARQAFAMIDQKKWSDANTKARDAYLLRPAEPEGWRAIARLASRTGQGATALEWWKKVDGEHRLTVEDRREYAGAALAAGEISVAAKQVEALLAQRNGPAPIDIVFAGQVAARQSDPVLAVDYAERALADKRAKPYEILAAATLILSVTTPYSQPYASAWQQIEAVARDPKNPGSLDALVVLAREEALPPMPPVGGNASLSLDTTSTFKSTPDTQFGDTLTLNLTATPPPAPPGRTMSLTEVANALEKHPDASPYHKLLALEVRARQDVILTDHYVADAVERFGNAARLAQLYEGSAQLADDTLAALAAWLNKIGRPAKTLEVLPQARASQRQDLFLHYLNALAALQRWSDVKDLLTRERFPIEPVLQHMYLAAAQTHLGSATAATNEWQRALEAANTPEKLLALAGYAEQNHANDVADRAYSEAIRLTPKNRGAYVGRLRVALTSDHTAEAQTIAEEIVKLWPDDAAARNQNDYLRLLLGASGDVAEAAERQAQILVAQEPLNWSARATLGLARLRLGRNADALAVFRTVRATGSEPPGALAVRAAILAVNGYEEGARGDAHNLGAERLLPEERALIAPLLGD
jgi:tetratricopeptide (TPR) repeat protein